MAFELSDSNQQLFVNCLRAAQYATGGNPMDRTRKKEVVMARKLVSWTMKTCTTASLDRIGRLFGGKDHATILHNISTLNTHLEVDDEIQRLFREYVGCLKRLGVTTTGIEERANKVNRKMFVRPVMPTDTVRLKFNLMAQ